MIPKNEFRLEGYISTNPFTEIFLQNRFNHRRSTTKKMEKALNIDW